MCDLHKRGICCGCLPRWTNPLVHGTALVNQLLYNMWPIFTSWVTTGTIILVALRGCWGYVTLMFDATPPEDCSCPKGVCQCIYTILYMHIYISYIYVYTDLYIDINQYKSYIYIHIFNCLDKLRCDLMARRPWKDFCLWGNSPLERVFIWAAWCSAWWNMKFDLHKIENEMIWYDWNWNEMNDLH